MVDLSAVPIVALSHETKFIISTRLNPQKVLQTCDKLFRDWRGLAGLLGLGGEVIPSICQSPDPTAAVIEFLKSRKIKVTLQELLEALERLDRWDVVDDALEVLEKDARDYLERLEKGNAEAIDAVDKQVLTVDDLYRCDAGLPTQNYDAFLLYADEDTEFITELIDNLENKANLRLCIKDRDLIGSATFEHDAIMQLISDRCNRLIVILSPNFVKGPINEFFLNYAQVTGIYRQQRKIVPVLYKNCEIPRQLHHTFILDYNRNGFYDFWGRLRDSVRSVRVPATSATPEIKKIPEKLREDVGKSQGPEEIPEKSNNLTNSKKKNIFFRFSMKQTVKHNEKIDFPSLEGLDDLGEEKSKELMKKEKKRGLGNYKKKIKALVTRS